MPASPVSLTKVPEGKILIKGAHNNAQGEHVYGITFLALVNNAWEKVGETDYADGELGNTPVVRLY